MVARYTEVEAIYLEHKATTNLEEKFKTCLIDLYAKILEYQVTAACHCKRNTFGKIRCRTGTWVMRHLAKWDTFYQVHEQNNQIRSEVLWIDLK